HSSKVTDGRGRARRPPPSRGRAPRRAAPERPAPDLRRPAGAARRSARAAPRRDLGRDRQVTVAGARSAWRWIGGRGAATRAPARWAARWPPAGAARRAWGGPL